MRLCFILAAALSLLPFRAPAQDNRPDGPRKISAAEAEKHYNETVVVTGRIAQVTIREKLVYLNLEKPFPATPFTAVIFARATNQFGDLSRLQGKQVEIRGKLEEYREKPQIILNSTNQLKVVEESK